MRNLLAVIVGAIVAGGIASLVFGVSFSNGIQRSPVPATTVVTHVTQEVAPPMPPTHHHYHYQRVTQPVYPQPAAARSTSAKPAKSAAPQHGCTVTNRTTVTVNAKGRTSTTTMHGTTCH